MLSPSTQGHIGIRMGERFEIPAGEGPGAEFPRAAPGAYEVSGRTRRGFIFGACDSDSAARESVLAPLAPYLHCSDTPIAQPSSTVQRAR